MDTKDIEKIALGTVSVMMMAGIAMLVLQQTQQAAEPPAEPPTEPPIEPPEVPPTPPEPAPYKANLYGAVSDKDTGGAVLGASISLNSHVTQSGTSGGYTLSDIDPGVYVFTVSKTGYGTVSTDVTVPAGNNLLNVELIQEVITTGLKMNNLTLLEFYGKKVSETKGMAPRPEKPEEVLPYSEISSPLTVKAIYEGEYHWPIKWRIEGVCFDPIGGGYAGLWFALTFEKLGLEVALGGNSMGAGCAPVSGSTTLTHGPVDGRGGSRWIGSYWAYIQWMLVFADGNRSGGGSGLIKDALVITG